MGVSIGEKSQGSSWQDCHEECDWMPECSAWTFDDSYTSCAFFSRVVSIDPNNSTLSGQKNCPNPPAVMVNSGKNLDLPEDTPCIMEKVKIGGEKVASRKRQEFIITTILFIRPFIQDISPDISPNHISRISGRYAPIFSSISLFFVT